MFQDIKPFSGYSVDDIDKAKQFYSQTLGLPVDEMPGMGFTIIFASGHNIFIYPKADHQPATFTVLNFPVNDIDVVIDELESKGIKMINYDNPNMPQDEKGVLRGRNVNMGPDIAWFTDPAGNILSILQQ